MSADGQSVIASWLKEIQPRTRRRIEKTTDGRRLLIDHAEILRTTSAPASIEFIGEHGLDLVAVKERRAGIGHDDFADVDPFKDFVGCRMSALTRTLRVSTVLPLTTCTVRWSIAVLGTATPQLRLASIEARANTPTFSDGLAEDADADAAELRGAVDLRANQPDPADQIGRHPG